MLEFFLVAVTGDIGKTGKHEIEESKEARSGKDNGNDIGDELGEASVHTAVGGNGRVDGAKSASHKFTNYC